MLPQNLADGKTIRQLIPANSITRFQLLMKIPLTILFIGYLYGCRITTKSIIDIYRSWKYIISYFCHKIFACIYVFRNNLINMISH